MKNQFEDSMSKRTDEEIEKILSSKPGDYQTEAVDAAIVEAKRRNLNFDYTNVNAQVANDEVLKEFNSALIGERYPALRFISSIYRLSAWIILFVSIIFSIYFISQGQMNIQYGIGAILIGLIIFISFLAISEGIKVFIDIEHNTRITAINSKK